MFTKKIQVNRAIFHGKPLVSIAGGNIDKRLEGSRINYYLFQQRPYHVSWISYHFSENTPVDWVTV